MTLDRRAARVLLIAVFLTVQAYYFAAYAFADYDDEGPPPCDGGGPTSSGACFR